MNLMIGPQWAPRAIGLREGEMFSARTPSRSPVHRPVAYLEARRLVVVLTLNSALIPQEQRHLSPRCDQQQRHDVAGRPRRTIATSWSRKSTEQRVKSRPHAGALRRTWRPSAVFGCRCASRSISRNIHVSSTVALRHREIRGFVRQIWFERPDPRTRGDDVSLGLPLSRGTAAQGRSCDLFISHIRRRPPITLAALRYSKPGVHTAFGGHVRHRRSRAKARPCCLSCGSGDRRRFPRPSRAS